MDSTVLDGGASDRDGDDGLVMVMLEESILPVKRITRGISQSILLYVM